MSYWRAMREETPRRIMRAEALSAPYDEHKAIPAEQDPYGLMSTQARENLTVTRWLPRLRWLPFVTTLIYLSLCLWVLVEAYIATGPSVKLSSPISGTSTHLGSKYCAYVKDCILTLPAPPTSHPY